MNGIGPSSSSMLRSYSPIEGQGGSPSSTGEVCGSGVNIAHRHITEHVGTQSAGLQKVMELLKADDIAGAKQVFNENVDSFSPADVAQSLREAFEEQRKRGLKYQTTVLYLVNESVFTQSNEKADALFCALNINGFDGYFEFIKFLCIGEASNLKKGFSAWMSKHCATILPEIVLSSNTISQEGMHTIFNMMDQYQHIDEVVGSMVHSLIEDGLNEKSIDKINVLIECVCQRRLSTLIANDVEFSDEALFFSISKSVVFDSIVCAVKEWCFSAEDFLLLDKKTELINGVYGFCCLDVGKNILSKDDFKKCIVDVVTLIGKYTTDVIFKWYSMESRHALRSALISVKDAELLKKSNKMICFLSVGVEQERLKDEIFGLYCGCSDKDYLGLVYTLANKMGAPIENMHATIDMQMYLISGSWSDAFKRLRLIDKVSQRECQRALSNVHAFLKDRIDDYLIFSDMFFDREFEILFKVIERLCLDGGVGNDTLIQVFKIIGQYVHKAIIIDVSEEEKEIALSRLGKYRGMIDRCHSHFNVGLCDVIPDGLQRKIKKLLISNPVSHCGWIGYVTLTESEVNELIKQVCNDSYTLGILNHLIGMDVKLDQETRKHIEESFTENPFLGENDQFKTDRRKEFLSIPEHQTIRASYEQLKEK